MADAYQVRLFVYSPGDTEAERLRVNAVSDRLNKLYRPAARFDVTVGGGADDTVEEFDIVIALLEPAAELPPALPRASDVYLFRRASPPARDIESESYAERQTSLDALIERGLRPRGTRFHIELRGFANPDDFEVQLERLLRGWIAAQASAAVALRAAVASTPRRRGRLSAFAVLAAVLFAGAAAGAGYYWLEAQRALDHATSIFAELTEAASQTVQPHAQLDSVEALLARTRQTMQDTASWSNDPGVIRHRVRTNLILAEIDLDRGRAERALGHAAAALSGIEPLAKSGDLEARHLRAQAERLLGAAEWQTSGDANSHRRYDRAIAELTDLLARGIDPKISWRWMRSLAELHQAKGDAMLFRFGTPREALESFDKSRELRLLLVQLGHTGARFEYELAWITNRRGDVDYRLGNYEAALKLYVDARERLDGLQDGIWDDLKWAADLGTINNNIGLIKRRQRRFSEAEAIFARAEELLKTVHNRDPGNVNRSLALNWTRYIRAENLFRWALTSNDRIRLVAVREQVKSMIAFNDKVIAPHASHKQALHNTARETALLSAIDATLRQLNGNFEGAAAGYSEAAEIIANRYLPDARKMPWPDMLKENIEYLEWAGIAYGKAQKTPEAQALFKRALEMLAEYRAVLQPNLVEEFQKRIEARL